MFSKIRDNQRYKVQYNFANTSNIQQRSAQNSRLPRPSNVNVNHESTSGHINSQNCDVFNNTVDGRNNGNLAIADSGHGSNRMLAGSFNIFSKKRIRRSQIKRALITWAKNFEPGENRYAVRDRILECIQKRDTVLNLANLNVKSLPAEIGYLAGLSELNLSGNRLTALPDSFGNIAGLSELNLSGNQLTALPDSFGNLTGLSDLNLSGNKLTALPDSFGNLTGVGRLKLNLSGNRLTALPNSFGNLTELNDLNLSNNRLTALPNSFGNLSELGRLDLSDNQLTMLPDSFANLTRLSYLYWNRSQFTALPDFIGNLTGLHTLCLENNQLTALPESFSNLTGLNRLHLSNNQLTAVPDFIGNLTRLHTLRLENNQLSRLPNSLGNLTELRTLRLDSNQLTVLPNSFGNLIWLSTLHLDSNQLTALPDSFNNLTALHRLYLSRNQLTALPPGIFHLPQETEVNLEQNPLSPQTLIAMTQPRNHGPRIYFSVAEAPAAQTQGSGSRSFEDAIRRYCSNISTEYLRILQGTEGADYFGQLLDRLDGTTGPMATAEASLPGFADRVAAVIRTLAEVNSAELRASCYLQAQEGLETCSDRVAITFSDIEIACKSHRILQAGGGHAQMAHLLRGMFRLSTLDAFARNDIATRRGVDEIEVFLAYRVGLKNELELPCETSAMNHNEFSGVAQAALDRARTHVLAAERANNSAALVEFAIEQPFWNTHLEKNQGFQKQKQDIEAVFQMVGEELEERAQAMSGKEYVQKYNTLAANRDAMLRDIQREYTREILHRF